MASWLAANAPTLGRIPDQIPASAEVPLSECPTAELDLLCSQLQREDVEILRLDRPPSRDLPVGATLMDQYDQLGRLRQTVADLERGGVDIEAVDGVDDALLNELTTAAAAAAERLEGLERPMGARRP